MELTIRFPNGTITQSLDTLCEISGKTRSSLAISIYNMASSYEIIIPVRTEMNIHDLLPKIKKLRKIGCIVSANKLLVSLTYDLVSLAMEMNEPEIANQLEECIILLKLKHGI